MSKKVALSAIALLFASAVTYAYTVVPCATYLHATQHAHVMNKSSGHGFMVTRTIHGDVSSEKYILSDGKVIKGQSRVVKGQSYCAAYLKKGHHYVNDGTYMIYKKHDGYLVDVTYVNHHTQTLHVYPLTK
jgi:hypothetical protein